MAHKPKVLLFAFAAIVLVAAGAAFLIAHHRKPQTAAIASGYVDPALCASCHSAIAASYHKTGMGHSFSRPSSGKMMGDFTAHNRLCNQPSGLCYEMLAHDGRYFERRYEIGFDGKQSSVMEESVDAVIGSGNHAQTFLHRNAAGNLIELPVSWYSEQHGYWAMSPGYDRAEQEDFRRDVPQECLFCHNAYPPADQMPAQTQGERAVFGQQLPEGIDCQRCHGPGAAHVATARSGKATFDTIRAAIVNPARLDRDRKLEVCMQCHLETSSRNMPNELRDFGREVFSFRPGQPLGQYQIYLEQVPASAKGDVFEIAHQAYRLRQSACFRNSTMTCLTCHDPHSIPRGQEAAQHYQQVCLGCHQNVAHTVGLSSTSHCVDCHMPKRRTEDAVHVVMTDHYIQRLMPKRDLLAPLPEVVDTYVSGSKIDLYYPPTAATPQSQLLLASAKVSGRHPAASDMAALKDLLNGEHGTRPEPWLALGRAYAKTGQNEDAVRCFDHVLEQDPENVTALAELTPVLFATGGQQRAIGLLEQAVARHPVNALLLTNLGNAYLQQGNVARAQQLLQRSLEVDPEDAEAENLLGLASLRLGDSARAENYFRESIRLNPRNAVAQNNLGNLLSGHSNAEAEYHFERAITIDPGYAEAHHGYGLVLILNHQYPQALNQLQEAIRLDPRNASALSDLGDLLAAQGRTADAADAYRRVLSLTNDPSIAGPAADALRQLGR